MMMMIMMMIIMMTRRKGLLLLTYLPTSYVLLQSWEQGRGYNNNQNNKSHVPNKINAVQYHYHASPAPGTVVVEGLSS